MKQNRKVILITGAATGIGSSIAKSYIDEGHNVHICDYDKKRLQEFLDKNPNATGNLADVSNPDDVKDTFHIINNFIYNLTFKLCVLCKVFSPNTRIFKCLICHFTIA